MRYIKEFRDGEHIVGHYLCKFKQTQLTKAGKNYYALKLQDKTSVIDAKVWELTRDIGDFEEGDVIKVDALAQLYQGEMQMKVSKLRRSMEGEYSISDYIPATEKDVEEMYSRVVALINSMKNPHIKKLAENIYVNNKDNVAKIKTHSAAKQMHHGYLGGFLEHVLSVTEICDFLSGQYTKYVNRDILLAGGLLHDIGKLWELSPLPKNEYTDEGQMLGHIVIGVEMVGEEIRKIEGFPVQLGTIIKHLIISHHGEYEFGSPKIPYTSEAMLLHFADNIDAKLKTIEELLDKDTTPGPWTGYQKALGRYLRTSEF